MTTNLLRVLQGVKLWISWGRDNAQSSTSLPVSRIEVDATECADTCTITFIYLYVGLLSVCHIVHVGCTVHAEIRVTL